MVLTVLCNCDEHREIVYFLSLIWLFVCLFLYFIIQISDVPLPQMLPEGCSKKDQIKSTQAVNDDYSNTGYERGQLNPNSYQCQDGHYATFTLTNAVPMDACFNQVNWKLWQDAVKDLLKTQPKDQGTAYLVTGAVPSENSIPKKGKFDDDGARDFNRVIIPSHVWTAVCYKHNVDSESFSFGYIGLNNPDSRINIGTISELNDLLSTLYGGPAVKIFTDDCFSATIKSKKIFKHLHETIQSSINRMNMSTNTHSACYAPTAGFEAESACLLPEEPSNMGQGVGDKKGNGNLCFSPCDLYGEKYTWCYTEKNSGVWDYCCLVANSSLSALHGRTCSSDFPCNYYGKSYLWCRTLDNTWDYCCTQYK